LCELHKSSSRDSTHLNWFFEPALPDIKIITANSCWFKNSAD